MKELHSEVLNDYEHTMLRLMDQHQTEAGFPQPEAYGVDRKKVEDYLAAAQFILDSEGSQKAQLTKYGIIALIPILILSAFPESLLPWGKHSFVVGIAMGLCLALLLKAIAVTLKRFRLNRHRGANPHAAAYIDAVEAFNRKQS